MKFQAELGMVSIVSQAMEVDCLDRCAQGSQGTKNGYEEIVTVSPKQLAEDRDESKRALSRRRESSAVKTQLAS